MSLRKVSITPALRRGWLPLVAVLLVAACVSNYSQSSLRPDTDFTSMLDGVFFTTVKWAVLVFVLVEGALLFAIFKFRGKETDPEPAQTHGNTTVEVVWTIIPAVILAIIAVPTINAIFKTYQRPKNTVRVEVIGHQWWWEFRYPDLKVVTANELHVPAGKEVSLYMTSGDVIHSFWLPRLAGKRDVFPKRFNTLWFTAPDTGTYTGQCAEFCGEEHGRMAFRVKVDTPDSFATWVQNEQVGSPMVNKGQVSDSVLATIADSVTRARGGQLFLSAGCIGCHAMMGTPTAGVMTMMGPNLSHVGSRTHIVADMLENTPENLARWLHNPQAVKPGALMKLPRPLTDDEVQALVAFLEAHK